LVGKSVGLEDTSAEGRFVKEFCRWGKELKMLTYSVWFRVEPSECFYERDGCNLSSINQYLSWLFQ